MGMTENKKHSDAVLAAVMSPKSRLWPAFDYADQIYRKSVYMKRCIAAGIPMIPTIFIDDGFEPGDLLRQIKAKGWAKFFIKPAYLVCYGDGSFHGTTADFLKDPTPLIEYEKSVKAQREFLVQPYMLKPNGDVFDEIRHFFIDGKFAYAVFTHGTDPEGFWTQPEGPVLRRTRALAEKTYAQVLKMARWQGKPFTTMLNRIDVGVMPDATQPAEVRIFVNEIEMEMTTWLARYCPFNLANFMAPVVVKKARELFQGLFDANKHVPDAAHVNELLRVLDERLGSLDESGPQEAVAALQAGKTASRKRAAVADVGQAAAKRFRARGGYV
eukprot:NODE_1111_length_1238_cov_277.834320.p1 GENE.NODE_1111_length_1238_cov_277.834320~~NODE_1111_length_1238_cov_277.834320.p1  ORF type:complete len:328 (+),score=88.84 NODE_1111_length_1238_cov_277.834320:3-986(+)